MSTEPTAEKGTPWGWIIFWIVLGLLVIGGVYTFIFSPWAKKKALFKKVIAKHAELKMEALMTQYKGKTYAQTLGAINAAYPSDKY